MDQQRQGAQINMPARILNLERFYAALFEVWGKYGSCMTEQAAANALDQGQYSLDEIRKYETIYGRNFISPGGQAAARDIISLASFRPNMEVLDVGCGLGGAAFLIAQIFGARVHGIEFLAICSSLPRCAARRLS